jgi:quercetin dioxygenase-like cupin family protein
VDDLDLDSRTRPNAWAFVDVAELVDGGSGALWSLPHGGDLDANLVQLSSGEEIAQHVNSEVDVFVVVCDGTGALTVDDRRLPLRPGVAVLVPRDTRRAIRAGRDGVRYFSVHRRRDSLAVGRR